jgi:hypothetical protein
MMLGKQLRRRPQQPQGSRDRTGPKDTSEGHAARLTSKTDVGGPRPAKPTVDRVGPRRVQLHLTKEEEELLAEINSAMKKAAHKGSKLEVFM